MSSRMTVAALVVALVITGAIGAVGVTMCRYHFTGQEADGSYVFRTDPEVIDESVKADPNGGTIQHTVITKQTMASMRPKDAENASIEQMQADLEEIDQLRQQGARRLVRTIDRETEEGPVRINVYEYTLSDGRTITMAENERDPN